MDFQAYAQSIFHLQVNEQCVTDAYLIDPMHAICHGRENSWLHLVVHDIAC